ncbi:MAG: class II aldolase/adducin family protein [Ignavibacteria bacterium]|nr:class II aldolase/adducin family protein [Ignavibacteria bacterium]
MNILNYNPEMGLRENLLKYSKLCYKNGFVKATDGNLSVRTKKNYILSTRSCICKGKITDSDIIKTDINGKLISGKGNISTEIKLHLYVYRKRKDVNAVIHTHPKFATAFATAGIGLDKVVLPEIYLTFGKIPLAKYATPSTDEVVSSVSKLIERYNAVLLSNHGLVTFGKTLEEAFYFTEKVEQCAEIIFYARMLGGEKVLNKQQIGKLDRIKLK